MKEPLEPLGTRVEPGLGQRLRVYAAVNRRNITEVVAAALDSYLPLLADLVREADDAGAHEDAGELLENDAALAIARQGREPDQNPTTQMEERTR